MEKDNSMNNPNGAEWFAAWLPKAPLEDLRAFAPEAIASQVFAEIEQPADFQPIDWTVEVRTELEQVVQSLLDPSAAGVRSSLPHLERAVAVFGRQIKFIDVPADSANLKPAIEALQNELKQASRLFENAYTLQSGWASHLGINLDGTPRKVLYDRSGEMIVDLPIEDHSAVVPVWEG